MKRILSVLTLLALLAFGSVAVAQTVTVCDKDNNLDCTVLPKPQFDDAMYGIDNYVRTLLGLPPLLTPMTTVCDKGSTTDCRQVPTALTDNLMHGLDGYLLNRAETVAVDVLAAADVVSADDVDGMIDTALAGYSTTGQMNTAITNATSNKVTGAQVDTAIATALASYSTTGQMNTAITNATSNKVTGAQVDTAISTALASYSTTGQVNTAISAATADKPSTAQVQTIADDAAAAAVADKTDVPQVEGIVDDALTDYAKTADVEGAGYLTQTEVETIAADAAATAVATALASYQASGPGVAKAWWGRTNSGSQKNHNLTAPSLSGATGTFSFVAPLSSLNYVVLVTTQGSASNCPVTSQTFTGFFVNCGSGTLSDVRSIVVFDN